MIRARTPMPVRGSPHRYASPGASKRVASVLADEWTVGATKGAARAAVRVGRTDTHAPVIVLDADPGRALQLLSRQRFRLEPFHTYRVSVVLGGPPSSQMSFGFVCLVGDGTDRRRADRTVWPIAAGGTCPSGREESGYLVNGPKRVGAALFVKRGPVRRAVNNEPSRAFFHRVLLADCGRLPPAPAVYYREEFEGLGASPVPKGYTLVFAKKGQVRSAGEEGCRFIHNTRGRAALFGPLQPARFGSVYALTVRAKGSGTVSLRLLPYMGQAGRFAASHSETARLKANTWSSVSLTAGQHVPQADFMCPFIDLQGPVSLDWIELRGPLRRP